MSDDSNEHTVDARDSFRINHDVLFEHKMVEAYAAQHHDVHTELPPTQETNLLAQLQAINKNNQQALHVLSENNRLLGDYLQAMSEKIDLIAQHIAFHNSPEATPSHKNKEKKEEKKDTHKTTRINLGENGLSFFSNRALYQGNYLAIRVTFLPSYTTITTFATIVRCEPIHDEYKIAAQFYKLTEASRKEITREILRSQITRKRDQI